MLRKSFLLYALITHCTVTAQSFGPIKTKSFYFDVDNFSLNEESMKLLKVFTDEVKNTTIEIVEIIGYIEGDGAIVYNKIKSKKRIDAIKNTIDNSITVHQYKPLNIDYAPAFLYTYEDGFNWRRVDITYRQILEFKNSDNDFEGDKTIANNDLFKRNSKYNSNSNKGENTIFELSDGGLGTTIKTKLDKKQSLLTKNNTSDYQQNNNSQINNDSAKSRDNKTAISENEISNTILNGIKNNLSQNNNSTASNKNTKSENSNSEVNSSNKNISNNNASEVKNNAFNQSENSNQNNSTASNQNTKSEGSNSEINSNNQNIKEEKEINNNYKPDLEENEFGEVNIEGRSQEEIDNMVISSPSRKGSRYSKNIPSVDMSKRLSEINVDNLDKSVVLITLNIQFEGNKPITTAVSIKEMKDLFNFLYYNPAVDAFIRGHVCCGDEMTLSKKRAKHVYKELIKRGISEERLRYQGFSNSLLLVNPERSEADRRMNRRVDIILSKNKNANNAPVVISQEVFDKSVEEIKTNKKVIQEVPEENKSEKILEINLFKQPIFKKERFKKLFKRKE